MDGIHISQPLFEELDRELWCTLVEDQFLTAWRLETWSSQKQGKQNNYNM